MEPPDVICIGIDKLSKNDLEKFNNMLALLNYAFKNHDDYLFNRATTYIQELFKKSC